jgi:predicted nucleic acid-binding protein
MPFVLDASIAAVWALADESDHLADKAMEHIQFESALVPAVWWYEIRNVVVINERRKRLSIDESAAFLKILNSFPISIDDERNEQAILGYATRYQLSFYDAAYLELAHRNHLPLATLDKALRGAAESAGVSLLA